MTYHYRITVNDAIGPVLTTYPGKQWSHVMQVLDTRGGEAKLERRLVTDTGILDYFEAMPKGWIRLGDTIICEWETIAQDYQMRF